MTATPARQSRANDEQILEWVQLNENGTTMADIARQHHTTKGRVIGALNRVRNDDMAAHEPTN